MPKLLTSNYAIIPAYLALCLGQLLTKFLKRVWYENFLYKGCLDKKGGVQTPLHTVRINFLLLHPSIRTAKIETWAKTWNVLFGAAKCKITTISNQRDADGNHPPLHFFGVTLEEADNVDLLGLTLNNNLSGNQVVTKMSKTAGQWLGLLRRVSPYILPAHGAIIYKAMISDVTPMVSGWANPRAPSRGAPAGCPFTLVFQLRLPFHKSVPFQHFFHSLVAKFS